MIKYLYEPTMRVSRPPARLLQEVHVVLPRKIQLYPSDGQPKKYSREIRLPELAIQQSRIPKAGQGLFLREKVRKGQPIALYRRKIVSEAMAKKLKAMVIQFSEQ